MKKPEMLMICSKSNTCNAWSFCESSSPHRAEAYCKVKVGTCPACVPVKAKRKTPESESFPVNSERTFIRLICNDIELIKAKKGKGKK